MLVRAFEFLERRGAVLLVLGLAVGVAVQPLAALLNPLVTPSVMVLLTATVLRLDWDQVFRRLKAPGLPLLIVAWLMIGAPLVLWAAMAVIEPPEALRGPLLLAASSPVLISVPAFALMMGLDGPLALVLMVATSLLQPLIQPPLALLLVGVKLDVSLGELMLRLALLIGGSFAAAALIRHLAGEASIKRQGAAIGGVAVLMLVIFGIGVMHGITAQLLAEPARVLLFLAAVFIANFGLQAIGIAAFWLAAGTWGMSGREGLTAALASGNRNLATLVAALGGAAGPDLVLYLACNQFPLYIIPSVGGPIYRFLLRRKS